MRPKVLIIEDDSAICEGIADALSFAGYDAVQARHGDVGMRMAVEVDYDFLLLDLMLPGRDGMDILREVRLVRPTVPVIILTARGEEQDRVDGLRLGADDYVVKPFSARELLARIEAIMRRSPARPLDLSTARTSTGVIDFERREVRCADGEIHELSEREVDLLRYLASNHGRAISRDEILARVWGMNPRGVSTRTIDMHIARLREKIELNPAHPQNILTVRGKGYKWTAAQEPS